MNIYKQLLTVLLLLAALLCCAACSSGPGSGEWLMDADLHWHAGEDGSPMDAAAHIWEDGICSVCGKYEDEVWEYDDGTTEVYEYNQYGDVTAITAYDADGNQTSCTGYAYDYGEDASITAERVYTDGVLAEAYTYDEYGSMTEKLIYLPDGSISGKTRCEFTYDDEGCAVSQKIYRDDVLTDIEEYNQYGDTVKQTSYDAEGKTVYEARYEGEYDADGVLLTQKVYEWDVLTEEIVFDSYSDGWFDWLYSSGITYYLPDGTREVCSYDLDLALLSCAYYDASGALRYEEVYEYTYDDSGYILSAEAYDGERLSAQVEYVITDDGCNYETRKTCYHEDGSSTVIEYALDDEGWLYEAKKTFTAPDGTETVTRYDKYGSALT